MIDYGAVLKVLATAEVNFIMVGGYGAVAHGAEVVTHQSLELCYERTPENMKRMAGALAPYHPRRRDAPEAIPFVLDDRALAQGMNFALETDLGSIDLIGHLLGLEQFEEVARNCISVSLYGVLFRVASLDVIIRSKRAAGRAKDLNALPELEALKQLRDSREK
jgi:hypothetical protein